MYRYQRGDGLLNMLLIGLKKYRTRYIALIDDGRYYRYLTLSKRRMHTVVEYRKTEFNSFDHFLSVIKRFTQLSFYFKRPVPINSISMAEFERINADNTHF